MSDSGQWGGGAWVSVFACFGTAQTTFWLIVNKAPGRKDWLYWLVNSDPVFAADAA